MATITAERPTTAPELPLYRLHLMRAGYRLMGLGLAVVKCEGRQMALTDAASRLLAPARQREELRT